MKILVLGGDGYLGWPTAMYFSGRGDEVTIVDSFAKRGWEADVGVMPLWQVPTMQQRLRTWEKVSRKKIRFFSGDIAKDDRFVDHLLGEFRPDAIVHYAEQPSAPYSMLERRRAVYTQTNNITGTLNLLFVMYRDCPSTHLVKLGTMGEYGTPNIDIEEGFIDIEHKGRKDRLPFPKNAGSFYHLSKVFDSENIRKACEWWKLRSTDLNQGVVYGIDTDETELHHDLRTSFHYDAVFGTALNRFCVEAVCGEPLTVYGKGGQKRGFLNIRDTIQCVAIAVDNPPRIGEYRVFNQFTEVFSVLELAKMVQKVASVHGVKAEIQHLSNPRIEKEEHYYNPSNDSLIQLGLEPRKLSDELLESMFEKIKGAENRVDEFTLKPTIKWRFR